MMSDMWWRRRGDLAHSLSAKRTAMSSPSKAMHWAPRNFLPCARAGPGPVSHYITAGNICFCIVIKKGWLRAARAEAWEGKDPGSIRVLLYNPRWERRLLHFLGLSGVGRLVEMRAWRKPGQPGWTGGLHGKRGRGSPGRASCTFSLSFSSRYSFSFRLSFQEGPIPRALRTAHAGGGGFS